MPRVHFVKKARRAVPSAGIKVGDSYFWWKPMVGGRGGAKRFSKTRPRQSQVTQSEFLSAVYAAEESVQDALTEFQKVSEDGYDDLASALESAAEEVRQAGEDCREKFDNMPDGLQQGDSGQLLEQRADRCEEFADELESAAQEVRDADPGDEKLGEDDPDPREEAVGVIENLSWDFD